VQNRKTWLLKWNEAHAFAGDTAKATEYGRKAVAEAEGEDRERYEAALRKLLGK
jgi:hypothetical protein